jgi:DNA-directed RNA polymerase subunit RPC12/RpoP
MAAAPPPPSTPPAAGAPSPWDPVRRELQRARGARRLVPWTFLSGVLGAAFVSFAARSWRAGWPLFAAGLLLTILVVALSIPHCPSCGRNLWKRGESPGPPTAPRPTDVEEHRRCPHCGSRFGT